MKKILVLVLASFLILSKVAFSQITVDCNGNVGIGTSSPSYSFDVRGVATIGSGSDYFMFTTGPNGSNLISTDSYSGTIGYQEPLYSVTASYVYASNIAYSSDENLKSNIKPLFSALPIIKKLRPVSFDYKFDYSMVKNERFRTKLQNDDKDRLGFIAQEVQKLLPQTVKEKDSDSTLCIRMDDFIPLLVKGMQEQAEKIDSLTAVVEEMKASQEMLKSATITGTGSISATPAKLYQNTPNPFSENTVINCFIPNNTTDARLLVFDLQGTLVKTYKIAERAQASVTISGAELHAGMYIYSLVLDKREIDSKRMILTD